MPSIITSKILELLSHESLSLDPSNIRGQAYDGPSMMSSGISGVQAKIKEKCPLALYTYRTAIAIALVCI